MPEFIKIYDLPSPMAKTAQEEDKLWKNYYLNFNSLFVKTQAELNKRFDDYFSKCLFDVYKKQNISHVIVLSEPEFKNFLFQMLPLYRGLNKEIVINNDSEVISRDELCNEIKRIFGDCDKFLDIIEEDIPYGYHFFKYDGDEIYIIDTRKCKFINWYKLTHIGRDLHTDMKSKEELIKFLEDLYSAWSKENNDGK